MTWEQVLYFFSFGTLVASIVAGVFTPLCRKRKTMARVPSVEQPAVIEPVKKIDDQERIANAMRNWSAVRATSDLTFTQPTPEAEPEARVETIVEVAPEAYAEPESAPVVMIRDIEIPHTSTSADEPYANFQHENTSVSEANPFANYDFSKTPNFYEILQISPRADLETIHRVYRIMAARFHPDNPVSGNHERFLQLCEAYDVLSEPLKRQQYDVALRAQENRPIPIFETPIFVDGLDGEVNRRLGILALLYQRRRVNQAAPGISPLDLERRMALPREHLEFTLWYLRSKHFVQVMEDNSDYAVTAAGVDYVESNSERNPILRELLRVAGAHYRREAEQAPVSESPRNRRYQGRRGGRSRERGVVLA